MVMKRESDGRRVTIPNHDELPFNTNPILEMALTVSIPEIEGSLGIQFNVSNDVDVMGDGLSV